VKWCNSPIRTSHNVRCAKLTRIGGGKRMPRAGAEQSCYRSAPLGVVMMPVPFSRLAPPKRAQWLDGGLEGLEFGLDFEFGKAHLLKEGDVVASHGLGVGVI